MSAEVWLAEIEAYDPDAPGAVTLRFGTTGITTRPAETPANTFYDGVLLQPSQLTRAMFAPGATSGRSTVSAGDVVLSNADGALDGLLDYGYGRGITIRRGSAGAAYPGGFPVAYEGVVEYVTAEDTTLRLRLRDAALELDVPLQATKYDGDNTLPDGLEGVAGDLKGKAKPLVFGTVKNIAPPCVNTAKLIYQVSDGAVARVVDVYDRGISLTGIPVGWSTVSHGLSGDLDLRGAARNGSVIVATGFDSVAGAGVAVVSTDDGATWNRYAIGPVVGAGVSRWCVYGAGVFACNIDSTCYTSADNGQTWTSRGTTGESDCVYDADIGVFCAVDPTGAAYTSPDAVTAWTLQTTGTAQPLRGVTSGLGYLVAVGAGGTIITSDDAGVTWVARTSGTSGHLFAVRQDHGTFIACGDAGLVRRSTTATEWSAVNSGVTVFLVNPAYANGRWVMTGSFQGFPVSDDDGLTWYKPDDSVPTGAYQELIRTATGWLAFGDNVMARSYEITEYASEADLLDDDLAPPPGTWAVYLAGGLIRLGSPPAGLVTVDASHGATSADRTPGQLFAAVLSKAGYTSGDWDAGDVADLDTDAPYECGLYLEVDSPMTVAEALDTLAASAGAWWGVDRARVFRIQQFTAPAGAAVATFTENDIADGSFRRLALTEAGRGVPRHRTTLRYAPNYVTQDTDLALGVTDARRAELARPYREVVDEDAAVLTVHPLAIAAIETTTLASAADAETEAGRRQALRGTARARYQITVELDADTMALDLGDVVELRHPRHGLSAGALFRIIGITVDAQRRRVTLELWG